jgi:hypothetical protein
MSMAETTGDSRGRARRLWLCWLVPAVVALAVLWPAVKQPSAWLWPAKGDHSDLAVSHWPNALFTRQTVWQERRLPLWRPTIMSGAPFAADPLSGLCYVPNWLFLFTPWLPLEIGFNLSAIAHLWLAGAAMCALMRVAFRSGTWGALAAGVAYEVSPKLLAHLAAGHVGWTQAMGWLPLVVLCWLQALRPAGAGEPRARNLRWATAGGAAAACQFCADTRAAAYSLAAVGTLTAVWAVDRYRHSRRWAIGPGARQPAACPAGGWLGIGASGLAALVGLAACQWIPLAALLPHLTRSSMTLQDAAAWSLPWRYLAGLLIADHAGFHEWMTYLGVSTLMLGALGAWALWRRREERWLAWWLGILVSGAAWFSLGENGGLFSLLGSVVPGLGLLRVPPRAWALVTFGGAVLAGVGVDRIFGCASAAPRMRRAGRVLLAAVALFAALLVAGYWLGVGRPQPALLAFGIITPLTAGICLLPRTTTARRWAALAAVSMIALDLGIVDATLVRAWAEDEVFADGRAAAEWLAAQGSGFRVYSPSYSIPQHVAARYGLLLADGVDPLQLDVYAGYLTRAAGLEPSGYSVTLPPFPEGTDVRTALEGVVPDAEMLGLLGVRYAAAAFPISHPNWVDVGKLDGVHVYENRLYRPLEPLDVPGQIALADDTVLFSYDARPAYIGWAVSGLTAAGLLIGWLRTRPARGEGDE